MEEGKDKQQKEEIKAKLIYQYDSQIILKLKKLSVLYSRDNQTDLLSFECEKLNVDLKENNFTYKR